MLIKAGVDFLRGCIGNGSIYNIIIVMGIGPYLYALLHTSSIYIPLILDGAKTFEDCADCIIYGIKVFLNYENPYMIIYIHSKSCKIHLYTTAFGANISQAKISKNVKLEKKDISS